MLELTLWQLFFLILVGKELSIALLRLIPTVLSFYIMSFLDTFHTFQMLCKYKLETQQ